MPLPVEALSMLPTLAAGPSVSLAPVAAAAAPVALGAAIGGKVLPQLFNKLAQASMMKALPTPRSVYTGYDINPPPALSEMTKDIRQGYEDIVSKYTQPNDTWGLDYSDRFQKILDSAAVNADVLSPDTYDKIESMYDARYPLPWGTMDTYPEVFAHTLESRPWSTHGGIYDIDGGPFTYDFPDNFDDEMIDNLYQARDDFTSAHRNFLKKYHTKHWEYKLPSPTEAHANTALGRWYAEHNMMPSKPHQFDDLPF